jgi:uncharacterized phage protein (TIGR02216 family)
MMFRDLAHQHGRWAMGVLGWTPAAFWNATPGDVALAWRGWCDIRGIAGGAVACDRAALDALLSHYPD